MQNVSVIQRPSIFAGIAAAFILLVISLIAPGHAAAQTSIETSQLLPGTTQCQQLSIVKLQPHVYNGMLESYDVTVSDNSNAYVGILSTVNGSALPLDMITRWAGESGGLKIHVDTPETPVYASVPVTLTLLASPENQATCITQISFDVDMSSNIVLPPDTLGGLGITQPENVVAANNTPAAPHAGQTANTGHSVAAASSSSDIVGASIAAESVSQGTGSICANAGNAYRLWFILLVLYVALVAVVIFVEPWFLRESVLASTASILVPLILLLAFWYFSESCRAASWIPVSACVIAILGLFLAFREYETTPLLASPSAKA